MRFWVGVLFALLSLDPLPVTVIETEYDYMVTVVEVEAQRTPTPVLDSLVDWEEQDRQNECLWTFLQENEIEITLRNVLAAGEWTDINGGACALIGGQDAGRSLE
jgi:hypothetical protein